MHVRAYNYEEKENETTTRKEIVALVIVPRVVVVPGYWCTCVPVYRCTGLLLYRRTSILGYQCTCVRTIAHMSKQ